MTSVINVKCCVRLPVCLRDSAYLLRSLSLCVSDSVFVSVCDKCKMLCASPCLLARLCLSAALSVSLCLWFCLCVCLCICPPPPPPHTHTHTHTHTLSLSLCMHVWFSVVYTFPFVASPKNIYRDCKPYHHKFTGLSLENSTNKHLPSPFITCN